MKNRIVFMLCLLCCAQMSAFAQSRTVRGKVATDSGGPLAGVTVTAVQSQLTVTTDGNGMFAMNVPGTETDIDLSFLGYQRQRVSIAGRTDVIDVRLVPDDEVLDEVIVTGYQTERKKDLTGAVSVVKMEEVSAPLTGNVMKSIQGRVPGAFISASGSPDGTASVLIRGIGTLGNNNPLYIIDGMPSTSSMNEISGMDIASIQVLKDASSSSIYGSRAANGVIVITTKKGKGGRTKIDARASSAVKNYAKSLEWLNTEQRGWAQWRAARNDGTNPNFGVYSFQDHQDGNGNWQLDRVVIPQFIDADQTMRAADTDWAKEIGRNAVVQNYNLTVTGGNEASRTLFAIDYFDNQGTVKGTYFERLSGRLNTDFDLVRGILNVGENLSLTKTRGDALSTVTASRSNTNIIAMTRNIWPIVPVHTMDGGWGGPVQGMSDRQNPVRLIADNAQNHGDRLRLFGDVHANVDILQGLRFRTMLGMDYSFAWERNMQKTYKSGYMSENEASVNSYSNRWGNYVWNNTLNYRFDLAGRHHFDVLGGQELIDFASEDLVGNRKGYASESPDYMYLNVGEGTQTNDGPATAYRLLSYFGKVNYNFGDRYLASVTARYDGSSRFGRNHRFGWFPAFSLGWRVSEERFFRSIAFISDLKIRYGWGKTGNQDIGDFASFGVYEATYGTNPTWNPDNGTAYDIAGTGTGTLPSGYRRIQRSNDDLRWESARQHNFGVDFGLFGQKLTGSFDYFNKQTSDILIAPPYIGTLGEGGTRWVNGAAMTNKGYELLLTYASTFNNDWRYSITGNLAGYRNRITELPADVVNSYPGNGNDQTILGRPLHSLFGYQADGLFTSMEQVNAHAAQIGKGLGRIRYADLSGNNSVGDEDRTWLGVMDPDFVYGLNFSLAYKQFDFGMFWNGLYGGLVNNEAKRFTDFISFFSGENYGTRVLDAWSPDNPTSDIPALSFDDLNDEKRFSSYFIESSSYFKLRTVEIGYTLPANLLQRFRSQGLRVYLLGENLLGFKKTWGKNKYTGVDPETPNSGYPIPFSVTAGLSMAF